MSKSTCQNWDRDYGDCGYCTGCLGEDVATETMRSVRMLEAICEHLGIEATR